MSWYAVEAIDEAIKDTKDLLLPFDLGTWLRLALIVAFTGAGIGFVNPVSFIPPDLDDIEDVNSTNSEVADNSNRVTESGANPVTGLATASSSISNTLWAIIGLSLVGLVLLVFYISSVFEFIYYQSLIDKDVSIRGNFRKHWLKGLQYFVFEIIYLLLVAALLMAIIAGFMINFGLGALGILLSIPAFIVLGVFVGLIHDFALLQMIDREQNLIASWRSLWPHIRDQWREVVIYIAVKLGIGIAIGIAMTILFFGLTIATVLIFGIIAVILGFLAEVLVLVPLLLGILLLGVLMLAVTIVIRTFLYFFIIEVYHDLTS